LSPPPELIVPTSQPVSQTLKPLPPVPPKRNVYSTELSPRDVPTSDVLESVSPEPLSPRTTRALIIPPRLGEGTDPSPHPISVEPVSKQTNVPRLPPRLPRPTSPTPRPSSPTLTSPIPQPLQTQVQATESTSSSLHSQGDTLSQLPSSSTQASSLHVQSTDNSTSQSKLQRPNELLNSSEEAVLETLRQEFKILQEKYDMEIQKNRKMELQLVETELKLSKYELRYGEVPD